MSSSSSISTITNGRFEITSVPLHEISDEQEDSIYQRHVVLKRVEMPTETGIVPIFFHRDDCANENIGTSILTNISEKNEITDSFIEELNILSKMKPKMEEDVPIKVQTIPKSYKELAQYGLSPTKPMENAKAMYGMNSLDNTSIQIMNTLSTLPSDLRRSLLYYLNAIASVNNETQEIEKKLQVKKE